MSASPRSTPPERPGRPSRPWRRRGILIAAAVALVAAGATGGAVLVTRGGQPTEEAPRPATARDAAVPSPEVSHDPRQAPPWGFTGSDWPDLCYGPVATPDARKQQPVSDTQSCRPGSRRITAVDQIALTASAGADVDRLEAGWGAIQPLPPSEAAARGAARFNWAPLVRRYRTMLRDGIRPIVVAYGSPGWARSHEPDRTGTCGPSGVGCVFPPAPQRIPQWRAFLRGLMVRLPEMRALEIWNEPNYVKFFAPHPDPELYARMLKAADQAARETRFHRPIITGGLAAVQSGPGRMPPPEFLSRLYEIAEKQTFDGIGTHPYPKGPSWTASMTASLDRVRAVSERFGDGSKPLWITEVGIGGTSGAGGPFDVPLRRQGPLLARMYRATKGMDVHSFLIFTLYDTGVTDSRFGTYGVLTPALRPKPAYCYLARHIGGTHACPRAGP